MLRFLQVLLSLPITLYFNFRSLKFTQAMKLPFLVNYRTRISEIHKGIITLPEKTEFAMIKIGWGGSSGVYSHSYNELKFEKNSKVVFKGKAVFSSGVSIRCSGYIEFGNHFNANKNVFISCSKRIIIGNDVLIGWNVSLRDSDGHCIFVNDYKKENRADVYIGNHVWICSEVHVLKGVMIQDNSVVGYGSLVTKAFEENGLIVGTPATIIQRKVNWEI